MKAKRFLVALLLVCLVVPVGTGMAEEEDSELFLLWDIPFGIGKDELARMVKQKTGIYMEELRSFRYEGILYYTPSDTEQDITMVGFPVESVGFTLMDDPETHFMYPGVENGYLYRDSRISFADTVVSASQIAEEGLSGQEIVQELMMDFEIFLGICRENYGEPTRMFCRVPGEKDSMGSAEERFGEIPLSQTVPPTEYITELYGIYEWCSLFVDFRNITLAMYMYSTAEDRYARVTLYYFDTSFEDYQEREEGSLIAFETMESLLDPNGGQYKDVVDVGL